MSPFMVWLQIYRVELTLALVGLLIVALVFVLWLFRRGAQQRDEIPPLDQALMELTDDELRDRGVLRSKED